ncbi:UDP-glucosyltransferase 29-like [Rutidosis leptorrhynchoides]|uniref:UDP-glucosyltransferase 29-like n=1 Tax=Rutidosis leptorrhynchoides TaxID=125765 RepID=UPI003A998F86
MFIPEKRFTILLFPWLGHGHISPFLELAKKLSNAKKENNKNHFEIYLCSTPANLESIRKTLPKNITLINLHLPTLPDLPPHLHTTNGLPLHLMPTLKQAFDDARPEFTKILKMLKPDLLIYDTIQCWAPLAAASFGIPSVVFIATSTTMAANMFHLYLNHSKGVPFPFPKIFYRAYEHKNVSEILQSSANNLKDKDRVMGCVLDSTSIVLVKSFREIEGKYADYLSKLTQKRIVPVGPLVADPKSSKQNSDEVIKWLDTKAVGSTVFVSFGSEYYLSKADLEEIAYGLELSNVNFIWVLRFPKSETQINASEALPKGFVERVKDRGLLVDGWAPQTKILGHKNLGGFVSHCGWNSVMETMKFGVPIIAMPMHLDQPVNARLVAEVGVGVEVLRDGNGRLKRENVAKVVQRVVVSEAGEVVRENAKKMSVDLKVKGEKEIDVVVDELLDLCKIGARLRGIERIGIRKTKSEAFALNMCCTVEGEV